MTQAELEIEKITLSKGKTDFFGVTGGGVSDANGVPTLNEDLIRRANGASFMVDAGDATVREYSKNVATIQNSNLSEAQKQVAIKELHAKTEAQLKAEGKAVNPYISGPARFNKSQVSKNADNAVSKHAEVNSFMNGINKQSDSIKKANDNNNLFSALKVAAAAGKLEVSVDGKTYYRSRKNSSTWKIR